MIYNSLKRLFDIFCALIGIIGTSPLWLIAITGILISDWGPIFYVATRIGKDNKPFKMYKFRTMTDERDPKTGELMPDEVRLTKFGTWLRSTSLDELPELFNILKGDMSVVGPRPLLVRYLPLYNTHQARRHEVRPGFTGYAQVHGRNAISWEEKFDLDVEYVDHVTFVGDWKIIFQTVRTVLKREGISSESSVTMEEFTGTQA